MISHLYFLKEKSRAKNNVHKVLKVSCAQTGNHITCIKLLALYKRLQLCSGETIEFQSVIISPIKPVNRSKDKLYFQL